MKAEPIRVLLVEDSPICLAILKRMLAQASDIQVVGAARNGKEALDLIPRVQPQVICTDLHMPVMDGLALTKTIMAQDPRAILVISNHVRRDDAQNIFQLLEAGAIDVFPKPRGGDEAAYQAHSEELIAKIRILSGVVAFRRSKRIASVQPSPPRTLEAPLRHRLMVVGASTGGPEALLALFSALPKDFPIPILCVQHISEGFLQGLVDWLNSKCALRVKIAAQGETPQAGTIYFPPEGTHLEIGHDGRLVLSTAPPKEGHRPSVDVTFCSAARIHGNALIGVLLTGMGKDGAQGMHSIAKAAGTTIAQDENSCVVFGMPRHAIQLGAASTVLALGDIAPTILGLVSAESTKKSYSLQEMATQ